MWVLIERCGENGMGGYGMLICSRQKRSGKKKGDWKAKERKGKEDKFELETLSTGILGKDVCTLPAQFSFRLWIIRYKGYMPIFLFSIPIFFVVVVRFLSLTKDSNLQSRRGGYFFVLESHSLWNTRF